MQAYSGDGSSHIRPEFFLVDLWELFFRFMIGGMKKKINKQDKFDEFISPDEGLFERNM